MDEGQMYDENGGYDDYDEAEEVTGALVATRQNKKKAAEDAKLLQKMDCAYGQGFYYAKPMPASEMEAYISNKTKHKK